LVIAGRKKQAVDNYKGYPPTGGKAEIKSVVLNLFNIVKI